MNILIIEDDILFAQHLRKILMINSLVHRVDLVDSLNSFMSVFSFLEWYDIILTDIKLSPDSSTLFDGFYVIRTIRDLAIKVPIIVISGRDDLSKIQWAFSLWANDYIIKWIRMKELELRIIHWFRYYHLWKMNLNENSLYEYWKLSYNMERNEFSLDETRIQLTKSNKIMLSIFFTHAEKLLSETFLVSKFWWDISFEMRRNIRIHVFRLRWALSPYGIHEWLRTIHGEGYMFSQTK